MQYWARYAQDNAPQLAERLAEVGKRYQEMHESIVARGPSSSQKINELIYEALELLDRGRA